MFHEHHIEEQDLLQLTLPRYILRSNFSCQNLQNGDVCIFICKDLSFNKIKNGKKRFQKFVLLN